MKTTWLVVHVGTVALLTVLTVVAAMQPTVDGEGVDFGLAFVAMGLVLLGLPWSLLYILATFSGASDLVSVTTTYVFGAVTVIGSAWLNIVWHWRWVKRGNPSRATGRL